MALSAIALGFLLPSRRRSSGAEVEGSVEQQTAYYEEQDREEALREDLLERRRKSLDIYRPKSARSAAFHRKNGSDGHEYDEMSPSSPVKSIELGTVVPDLARDSAEEGSGSSETSSGNKGERKSNGRGEQIQASFGDPAARFGKGIPRTVTIANEPPRVHRPIPLTATQTSKSISSGTPYIPAHSSPHDKPGRFGIFSAIAEDWHYRHDPAHKGFWQRVVRGITGAKEVEDDVRSPDWVPPSYRWTPILSGLIVPFSILLEIPGLTEHWYVRTEGNVAVEYQENPIILDVGLAISMACALMANLALISRFMERRVFKATVVAIVALTCHDLINIIAVTIFGVIHRFDDGFTYAEAFWLTVCSSVASVFTNATLIYDLVRTKNFRKAGSGLTPKQRSLVIAVMVLLAYIAFGSLVYNLMIKELTFQDALYFTVVSIETIGFGDLAPSNTQSRIFFFFYETLGVLNLAVAVGTARDTLLESWENAYRRRQKRLQQKHAERKKQRALEKARNRIIERKLAEIGAPVYVDAKLRGAGRGGRGAAGDRGGLNVGALSDFQMELAEREAEAEMEDEAGNGRGGRDLSSGTRREQALADMRDLQDDLSTQSSSSEDSYKVFIAQIAQEEKREGLVKFAFAFGLFLMFWILGSAVFHKTEGWSYFNAFYFCYVSFTTVGFGDFFPKTPAGRAFFIVWAIFGVATMTLLIAVIGESYERSYKNAVHKKGVNRAIKNIRRGSQATRLTRSNTVSSTALSRSETMTSGFSGETNENKEKGAGFFEEGERVAMISVEPESMEASDVHLDILEAVRGFHEHISYFVHHSSGEPSAALTRALNEMADKQAMTELEKEEVLGDQDARRVLFMMSYEQRLLKLMSALETAITPNPAEPPIQPITPLLS